MTENQAQIRAMRLEEVIEKIGVGRTTLYTLIKEGDFPRQVKYGGRASRWLEHEVDAWLRQKAEERDGGTLAGL